MMNSRETLTFLIMLTLLIGCSNSNSKRSIATKEKATQKTALQKQKIEKAEIKSVQLQKSKKRTYASIQLLSLRMPAKKPCHEKGVLAVVERMDNDIEKVDIHQPVMWSFSLAGCSSYRITPLGDTEAKPVTVDQNETTLTHYYSKIAKQYTQRFLIEGIDSAGFIDSKRIISSLPFNISDAPYFPKNYKCHAKILGKSANTISIDDNGVPTEALSLKFSLNTAGIKSTIHEVSALEAPLPILSQKLNAKGDIEVEVELKGVGYIPVDFTIQAKNNDSIHKSCRTVVKLNPKHPSGAVPTPEPPMCELVALNDSTAIGSQVSFRLYPTGITNWAQIGDKEVQLDINGGKKTLRAKKLGNHEIQASVSGPGGMGYCGTSYSVKRKPGLKAKVYKLATVKQLPKLNKLKSIGSFLTKNLDIPVTKGCSTSFPGMKRYKLKEGFAIKYKGYIDAPNSGKYDFKSFSDDGIRVKIGKSKVIDHSTIHKASFKDGSVYLEAGLHPIEVEYFQGPCDEFALQLSWKNPLSAHYSIISPESFTH